METCTIATRNREEMLDITDRVRAVVDSYKLASKRYQINFV